MKVDDSVSQPFSQPQVRLAEPAPTLALMHCAHVLAGFGTLLLGPILPLLSRHYHLTDAHAGLLPLAQFIGATLGGASVPARLSRGLLIGLTCAAAGFAIFAFAPGFYVALAGLFLGGFGNGRSIASINIVGGARFALNRGAALSRLNFTWSLGALLSPLLAASLTPRIALSTYVGTFAALFAACALALALQLRSGLPQAADAHEASAPQPRLARSLFLYFAALLFIYGGLETCLNVWLTTYALRYGQSSLVLSQYTLVLLLCGLTAGRALAAWLLLRIRDSALQRIALATSAALAAALAVAGSAALIATLAVLLGITLAPIFPATFALLMASHPPPRQAGIALAASGLGAAALPALMGLISTRTGSLQTALALPILAALGMLFLASLTPRISAVRASV